MQFADSVFRQVQSVDQDELYESRSIGPEKLVRVLEAFMVWTCVASTSLTPVGIFWTARQGTSLAGGHFDVGEIIVGRSALVAGNFAGDIELTDKVEHPLDDNWSAGLRVVDFHEMVLSLSQ